MVTRNQAWSLGSIATVLAILSGLFAMWSDLGWKTPNGHAEDIAVVAKQQTVSQAPVLSAIQALSTKVDVQSDRWLCDEDEEEIIAQRQEQVVRHTIEREVRIEKIQERQRVKNCTRFND